ncbi:MAG: IS200/IS605 family transposase [Capsulimonas sp.]|uniref:IS200/IS605 family transposase n=1 Tax=Capsulimonas sp. TaxID=2494211 RepID=UPI003265E92C
MAYVKRNTVNVYLHLVWATYQRNPLILDTMEPDIYRCIEDVCQKMNCQVLAIGGMSDHMHLAISFPTTISIAQLMQQVKGVSSTLVRNRIDEGEFFGWQEGYGVFSFSQKQCARVIGYIQNQKMHHSANKLWASVENIEALSHNPPSGTDG